MDRRGSHTSPLAMAKAEGEQVSRLHLFISSRRSELGAWSVAYDFPLLMLSLCEGISQRAHIIAVQPSRGRERTEIRIHSQDTRRRP